MSGNTSVSAPTSSAISTPITPFVNDFPHISVNEIIDCIKGKPLVLPSGLCSIAEGTTLNTLNFRTLVICAHNACKVHKFKLASSIISAIFTYALNCPQVAEEAERETVQLLTQLAFIIAKIKDWNRQTHCVLLLGTTSGLLSRCKPFDLQWMPYTRILKRLFKSLEKNLNMVYGSKGQDVQALRHAFDLEFALRNTIVLLVKYGVNLSQEVGQYINLFTHPFITAALVISKSNMYGNPALVGAARNNTRKSECVAFPPEKALWRHGRIYISFKDGTVGYRVKLVSEFVQGKNIELWKSDNGFYCFNAATAVFIQYHEDQTTVFEMPLVSNVETSSLHKGKGHIFEFLIKIQWIKNFWAKPLSHAFNCFIANEYTVQLYCGYHWAPNMDALLNQELNRHYLSVITSTTTRMQTPLLWDKQAPKMSIATIEINFALPKLYENNSHTSGSRDMSSLHQPYNSNSSPSAITVPPSFGKNTCTCTTNDDMRCSWQNNTMCQEPHLHILPLQDKSIMAKVFPKTSIALVQVHACNPSSPQTKSPISQALTFNPSTTVTILDAKHAHKCRRKQSSSTVARKRKKTRHAQAACKPKVRTEGNQPRSESAQSSPVPARFKSVSMGHYYAKTRSFGYSALIRRHLNKAKQLAKRQLQLQCRQVQGNFCKCRNKIETRLYLLLANSATRWRRLNHKYLIRLEKTNGKIDT